MITALAFGHSRIRERHFEWWLLLALFNRDERTGLISLYAVASLIEDAVFESGSTAEALETIGRMREALSGSLEDRELVSIFHDHPNLETVVKTWRELEFRMRAPIPFHYMQEYLQGLQDRVLRKTPSDTADFLRDTYRRAGVLGLAACHAIQGIDDRNLASMVDLVTSLYLKTRADALSMESREGSFSLPAEWRGHERRELLQYANVLQRSGHAGLSTSSFRVPLRLRLALLVPHAIALRTDRNTPWYKKLDVAFDETVRQLGLSFRQPANRISPRADNSLSTFEATLVIRNQTTRLGRYEQAIE